ncbi:MAG TPA: copper-containing nitrite reductase [Verrucomicrobiae bacterium]|nr:copper-containing nitrite reductase [Verrucomicrobiae bacterium]
MKLMTSLLAAAGIIAVVHTVVAAPLRVQAQLTFAPEVPPPIGRRPPAIVEVHLTSGVFTNQLKGDIKYAYWSFNGHTPGPFIRAREGDTLELHVANTDDSGKPHNCDLHAVTGPGGGAPVTTVVKGEERVSWFKLLQPGLFIYHCAAPPVMDHIANGMYGMILVEPKRGLPKVDREFFVMQSEVYTKDAPEDAEFLEYSHDKGLEERPTFVVFNGRVNSLTGKNSLKANEGERVRIYFGDAGPNLISSFHIIGTVFDKVYREGDLISPPARSVQTTLVPSGGATVVEFDAKVPGTYTLVDHAIFRIEQGAVGYLDVTGRAQCSIYHSDKDPVRCKGCLVHP